MLTTADLTWRMELAFEFDDVEYCMEVSYFEGSPGGWDEPPDAPEVDVLVCDKEYPETSEATTELFRQCAMRIEDLKRDAAEARAEAAAEWPVEDPPF